MTYSVLIISQRFISPPNVKELTFNLHTNLKSYKYSRDSKTGKYIQHIIIYKTFRSQSIIRLMAAFIFFIITRFIIFGFLFYIFICVIIFSFKWTVRERERERGGGGREELKSLVPDRIERRCLIRRNQYNGRSREEIFSSTFAAKSGSS